MQTKHTSHGSEVNRYGDPVDHYHKYMELIERNTDRLARQAKAQPARGQQTMALFTPSDPEFAAVLSERR